MSKYRILKLNDTYYCQKKSIFGQWKMLCEWSRYERAIWYLSTKTNAKIEMKPGEIVFECD